MFTKPIFTLFLIITVASQAVANGQTPIDEYSHQILEIACSDEAGKQLGVSDEVAAQAWTDYLSQDDVVSEADPRALFRLLSAVMPRLAEDQRQAFAHRYYRVLFKADPERPTSPEELILMGWCLVNSGLSHGDGTYPEFADAVLDYVKDKDHLGPEALNLLEGIQVDPDRFEGAMLTHLNLFWHEFIRDTLDDSACPFYRGLFSPSPVKWNYTTAYFLSMAINDDEAKDAARAVLIDDETGAPNRSVAEILCWSYNSNKVVLGKGLPKTLDYSDPEWSAYLEERVLDSSLPNDARSAWALIRAYAMESSRYYPSPLAGREWIDTAMELVESESARTDSVIYLATRLAGMRQYSQAIALLVPELDSITSKGLLRRLHVALESVQHQQALYESWQAEKQYQVELQGLITRLKGTRKHIERARNRGETPETIAAFEKALVSLKQQLFELEQKKPEQTP